MLMKYIFDGLPLIAEVGLHEGQDTAETDVHTLDDIRQLDVLTTTGKSFFGQLLYMVAWRRIVGQPQQPRESIQAVSHGDVDCLPEDAVLLLAVGQHLSVAPRYIQHHWIAAVCDHSAHLRNHKAGRLLEGIALNLQN